MEQVLLGRFGVDQARKQGQEICGLGGPLGWPGVEVEAIQGAALLAAGGGLPVVQQRDAAPPID